MSDQPDNSNSNQGGQPPEQQGGGQQPPQGGQQPQQGGQPPAGQQRRQPAQTGPGMGDILNREDTKQEIKTGLVVFVGVALGLGLAILLGDVLEDGYLFGYAELLGAFILAAYVAQQQSISLADVEDTLAYGTAGLTTAAGTIVYGIIIWLFWEISLDSGQGRLGAPEFGDMFLLWIAAAIGAAVTAVVIAYADRNL